MKTLIASLFALASAPAFAGCDIPTIQKNVEQYADQINVQMLTSFDNAEVVIKGILNPGEKTVVQVSIEDFPVENRTSKPQLVAALYGRNIVGASFWLAKLDPSTCQVISAFEALGEGGAGL